MVREAARDWPTGDLGRRNWEDVLYDADSCNAKLDVLHPANNVVLIYCLPDETPIGFVHFSILVGGGSGIDVHHLALLPEHRSKGHFSALASMMARLALHLNVDAVNYEALDAAPQVAQWARSRGGHIGIGRMSIGNHQKRRVKFRRAVIEAIDLTGISI